MSMDFSELDIQRTNVRIRLDRSLPLVCVHCGSPATHRVMMQFAKSKSGASSALGIIATVLGVLILGGHGLLLAHERRKDDTHDVRIPLCLDHRNFRRGYNVRVLIALSLAIAVIVATVMFASSSTATNLPALNGNSLTCLSVAFACALICLLMVQRIWAENILRGSSVTNQRMVLENVSPQFAKAVAERACSETEYVDSFLDELQGPAS
jgi:hypothetical protein